MRGRDEMYMQKLASNLELDTITVIDRQLYLMLIRFRFHNAVDVLSSSSLAPA